MRRDDELVKSRRRRKVIKTVGGTAVGLGVAGCLGDDSDDTQVMDGDDDTDIEDLDYEWMTDEEINPDEWPDLSGREVHILSQESSEEYQAYWQWLAERFNQATGAYVRMEYTGTGLGLTERISQLLQAGDPPELTHIGHPDTATFVDQGLMADHTEAVEVWEDRWSPFPDGATFTHDGEHAFLPLHANVKTNWYRADVFDEVPDSWESSLAMAEEHDEGEGGTRGWGISMRADVILIQHALFSAAWSNGVQFFEREGGDGEIYPAFADDHMDRMVETLEYFNSIYQYSDDFTDIDTGDMVRLVGDERSHQVGWVGARPKFHGEGQPFGEDIKSCPYPRAGGDGPIWGHVQGYGGFVDADQEAMIEFLKFWAEPEHFIGYYFADPIHNAPVLEEVRESDLYQQHLENVGDPWVIPEDLNFDWIEDGEELPAETSPPNEHSGTIIGSEELGEMVVDVCVRDEDPQDAIQNRADNIRNIIS